MRVLHVGANLFGHRHAQREPRRHAKLCDGEFGGCPAGADRRRNPRTDERQYLSLRGLSEHRRGNQTGCWITNMKSFTYQRADSLARAVTALTTPGTKVIAGGTNLLDLMKLQVESPSQLV